MGCSPSSDKSVDEEYIVPWIEQWRHAKSTVRAPQQLNIFDKSRYCDYCQIVKRVFNKHPADVKNVN